MNAVVEIEIDCPWCGERFPSVADTSQGSYQTIEDCQVCCRPIQLTIECEPGQVLFVLSNV